MVTKGSRPSCGAVASGGLTSSTRYADASIATAAGGPTTGDVVACTLGPLDEIDADLDLSDEQRQRLVAVFPFGVCDWTLPGRGQQPPTSSWPDFD